jgi:DNA-binding CsgD family transcriptional regulator
MKGKKDKKHKEAVIGPVVKKTPKAIMGRFFEENFPQMGAISRDAVVDKLIELIDKCYPSKDHFKMGQMMWFSVDKNETAGYGKPIEKCQLKPVYLDVITEGDILKVIEGERKKNIRKQIEVRLFEQSNDQGAVLSCADVASIINLSPSTVAGHIREYEKDTGKTVPRRGTIHDMGRSITHKKEICYKIIVEGKTVEQVSKETTHSPEAITRYVKDYKRISACLAQNLTDDTISYVTRTSKKLIQEYKKLIEENNIDIHKNFGKYNDVIF